MYSSPRVHCSKKELPAKTPQQVLLLQAKEVIKVQVGIWSTIPLRWPHLPSPWHLGAIVQQVMLCSIENGDQQLKVLLCFGYSGRDVRAEWWSQWVGAAEPQSFHVAWGWSDDLSGRAGRSPGLAYSLLRWPVWSGAGVYSAVRRGWEGDRSTVTCCQLWFFTGCCTGWSNIATGAHCWNSKGFLGTKFQGVSLLIIFISSW